MGIGMAFSRREKAAEVVAELKSTAMAMYLVHRDAWQSPDLGVKTIGEANNQARNAASVLARILTHVKSFLSTPVGDATELAQLTEIYRLFSSLSLLSTFSGEAAASAVGFTRGDAWLPPAPPLRMRPFGSRLPAVATHAPRHRLLFHTY